MTRIDKLYAQLLANPRHPIAFRDFEKLLRDSASSTSAPRAAIGSTCIQSFPARYRSNQRARTPNLTGSREFLELIEEYSLYMEE
jgi:hypothetical protein